MATLTQTQLLSIHDPTGSSEGTGLYAEGFSRLNGVPLPHTSTQPTSVLDVDKSTPDCHVPRDARLIRLTGIHPFNAEAPLTALYDEGFITSPELFYVRNHGAVPKVADENVPNWELIVEGLVKYPLILKFNQILSEFEQITAPVTLVCAGNRRKEQNQVRKSNGFSWGAAGVSTALFTGPLMLSILQRAVPLRSARYICMEGADTLPNGHYGTSVKLDWVMNPNNGIMLAHRMNGESLRPDHGRPLRAVVPGQIGGRSVKWLTKLIVTDAPSDNWYHLHDNKVLPTMVSPELASREQKWWKDERYAIYDLNVNSAIVYPKHNETISVLPTFTYTIRGYAYGGGGRRISRVEISLDKGKSWVLANIEYPEDRFREAEHSIYDGRVDISCHDKCFCWCFWDYSLPVPELEAADSILVRATDEALNIQPRDMYWSVLGMMNNPWYRIRIFKKGGVLTFEHPTQPASIQGGWMERVKASGGNLLGPNWGETDDGTMKILNTDAPIVQMTKVGLKTPISMKELQRHDSITKPWFVLEGEVYDGTSFLEQHPGGAQSIISAAGTDVTEEFMAIHSETAKGMMKDYHIGTLDGASLQEPKNGSPPEVAAPHETFLIPTSWSKATLKFKKTLSPDTRLFTFALDHDNQALGLPVGKHVMLKIEDPVDQKSVIRAYTPLSELFTKGKVDVLVKIYNPTPDYPLGGKMTMALDRLPIGATAEFKGPIGKFQYLGKGNVLASNEHRNVRKFYMICAGSGITPIFQVLRAVLQDVEDGTKCTVLDGNRSEIDILCQSELEFFSKEYGERCRIIHTLTQPSETWTGCRGRIGDKLLKQYIVHDERDMVLICGPNSLERNVRQFLLQQGWSCSSLIFF